MKIEVNDELILFSTDSREFSSDQCELDTNKVRIQIGKHTDNYSIVNIDTLIKSLEAMRTRE